MLLTTDTNGHSVLTLFDHGINIDQSLPKWVNASKRIAEKKKPEDNKQKNAPTTYTTIQLGSGTTSNVWDTPATNDTPFVVYNNSPEHYSIDKSVKFDEVAAASLAELTELIKNKELNNVLSGYGGMVNSLPVVSIDGSKEWAPDPQKSALANFFGKIKSAFTKKEPHYTLDVTRFFTEVKLATKDSAQNYRDRVSQYLKAIHNAHAVGQTALVEKLLSEMIANKYESLLFATGKYYVVTEQQVVDFAKKTEKGVDITYLKNYTRPIPAAVVDKIVESHSLEVFDNYVVMHYDPKKENQKETQKEIAKRKDPIVFGVISGSRKLYYITDWIDEYCDLTLEKFVDTIHVDKETLLEGDGQVATESTAPKKEAAKKPVKKK